MRVRLATSGGLGFDGGHDERHGLSPSGQRVPVPLHEHQVSLDYVRFELTLEYTFLDGWDARLRIPYDVKRQVSWIRLREQASVDEVRAMLRNNDLHHRSETLHGLADLHLLVTRRLGEVLVSGDALELSLGASLPSGATERDPYARGRAGLPHRHIQFGSGTLDPLLELGYFAPLPARFAASAHFAGRFPVYRNRKGYRGPVELTGGARLHRELTPWFALHGGALAYWQHHATWSGERDPNTGLVSVLAELGLRVNLSPSLALTTAVQYPLHQRTLARDSEAFEQGPIITVGLSWMLGP
ncbi:MAG: hypothetical protein M9894_09660 [Planctomycetes bacterium]|nr:hypothetical protein [Planctomycetota bacterium]